MIKNNYFYTHNIFSVLLLILLWACTRKHESQNQNDSKELSVEIESVLKNNILHFWYPACIDTVNGGYLSNFNARFEPQDIQDKMIVTQARHLWTTSKVAINYGDTSFLSYASQGFLFLQNKMWDKEYGGFYQHVDQRGIPFDKDALKTAYGNAFSIYGLSAYFKASGDSTALDLAKKTFLWLENHSHDPLNGGYFQHLSRKGAVIHRPDSITSTSDLGYKDQNSSIHLLEAFTSLYRIWPDSLMQVRLNEMFHLVKDVIVNDHHHMNLFFTADWTPVTYSDQDRQTILEHAWIDHISFGHDIETAYLLLEAAETLGISDTAIIDETRAMVDGALSGWDAEHGGIYDQGYLFKEGQPIEIIKDTKEWWAQAEALNTLLIFDSYFPEAGYDQYFLKQWKYITTYLVDSTYGGWYPYSLDTSPEAGNELKGQIWKATYHNYRALSNCVEHLKENKM